MIKIPSSVVINFLQSEVKSKPTTDGKEWKMNSIYTNDKKMKCYISPEKFQFIDFKSGEAGSCYKLFKDLLGLNTNKDVLVYLMKNYSTGGDKILFDNEKYEEKINTQNNTIEQFNLIDKPVYFFQKEKIGKFGVECLEYLNNRCIDVEYIRKMGYVFNSNSKFNKRIIIPYFEDGEMAYFQARSMDKNNKLRYLNPIGLDTKNYVFNYDKLNDDELIICEGAFDAMSMDDQVATCMCSGDLSVKQIKKIFMKSKPKHIIYVPDNDETGKKKMDDNIQRLITYSDYSPDILIFDVSKYGVKDLNEMKIKEGKNFILRSECEKYRKHRFRKFSFEE